MAAKSDEEGMIKLFNPAAPPSTLWMVARNSLSVEEELLDISFASSFEQAERSNGSANRRNLNRGAVDAVLGRVLVIFMPSRLIEQRRGYSLVGMMTPVTVEDVKRQSIATNRTVTGRDSEAS